MQFNYQFTVFTPSYNRAHTLTRVYTSLLNQTYRDFEWLIIDDGSSDNTQDLVNGWIQEQKIPIRYIYQENMHKFYSILKGAKLAQGEFFLTLDSDDEVVPEALQSLIDAWNTIPIKERKKYSAVTGLCKNQHGVIVGDKFPNDPFDSDSIESSLSYKIQGEKFGFQKTEVINSLDFPDIYFKNGLIPEGMIWLNIALRNYKTRYINSVLRIYYQDESTPSLMNDSPFKQNTFGVYKHEQLILNLPLKYLKQSPVRTLKALRLYSSAGFFQGESVLQQVKGINSRFVKILLLTFMVFGFLHFKIKS